MGLRQELTQKELILTQGAKVLLSAPVTASLTACISEIGLATKIREYSKLLYCNVFIEYFHPRFFFENVVTVRNVA